MRFRCKPDPRLWRIPKATVAAEDITAAQTPAGGWTRATLAQWGVPWPPPHGWRERVTKAA
jgi:hypothetical protein